MASRRRDRPPQGRQLLGVIDRAKRGLTSVQADAEASLGDATLLAAAVAHEVRNVLSPVLAYAQLALASPEDASLSERALAAASAGAERATLISEMIIEAARGGRSGQTADVNQAVQRAASLLPPGQPFHVQHEPVRGLTAPMSQVGLEHVLLNLLLNARAACGGGGVKVVARAAGGHLVISVADQGMGIDSVRLGRIFSPFVSGRRGGGRGLGLTVCQFLVEAAGGSIEAESEVGRGSCFNIYFPAAHPSKAAA